MRSRTTILAAILIVMAVLPSCPASSNKAAVVVPLGASTQARSASSKYGSVKAEKNPARLLRKSRKKQTNPLPPPPKELWKNDAYNCPSELLSKCIVRTIRLRASIWKPAVGVQTAAG
jgi:hypothetical protein